GPYGDQEEQDAPRKQQRADRARQTHRPREVEQETDDRGRSQGEDDQIGGSRQGVSRGGERRRTLEVSPCFPHRVILSEGAKRRVPEHHERKMTDGALTDLRSGGI